jgi:hypothetical protein
MNINIMPLVRLRHRLGLLDWRDIPWNSLPYWANYAVMDANGTWTAHKLEPVPYDENGDWWWLPNGIWEGEGAFITGPFVEFEWVYMNDWKNSMVCRYDPLGG